MRRRAAAVERVRRRVLLVVVVAVRRVSRLRACATSLSRLRNTVFAPPPSPNVQKKRRVLFRASTSESNENVCSRHGYSDLTVAQEAVR